MAMRPPPAAMVAALLAQGLVTAEQASLAPLVPMADDVAMEADSGGHTDNRPLHVVFPLIKALSRRIASECGFSAPVRVGAGGGIGCPEAVCAAFNLGADFVVTGTVNQMSRQSGSSDYVRAALAKAAYSDVTMAPAADMFDEGVELQVLKRGALLRQGSWLVGPVVGGAAYFLPTHASTHAVCCCMTRAHDYPRAGTMFPARARKLYELFKAYDSLDAVPAAEMAKLEKTTFRQPVAAVWEETRNFYLHRLKDPAKVARAERDPKTKMSMVFRWCVRGVALSFLVKCCKCRAVRTP
jgi:trans-AT polyketide synthase/acyltransferase/oxidoreductase domain-containing protein